MNQKVLFRLAPPGVKLIRFWHKVHHRDNEQNQLVVVSSVKLCCQLSDATNSATDQSSNDELLIIAGLLREVISRELELGLDSEQGSLSMAPCHLAESHLAYKTLADEVGLV